MVLVGRDQDDPGVWRRAVEIGADYVLMLPDGEQWLVDRIADVAEGVGRPALTVGVIGGRGGAGASTLACALAVTSAREGRRTLLVDADPLGGGLDVLLGGETTEGLRWPAFAASRGRLGGGRPGGAALARLRLLARPGRRGGVLEESLPELHALRVLSAGPGDCVAVPRPAGGARRGAARGAGRSWSTCRDGSTKGVAEVLAQLDLGLLVVPGELRAVAAAARVASAVGMVLADLRVAVRGPYAPGLDDREVARLLGLPLAGEVPVEAGLPARARVRTGRARPGKDRWPASAGGSGSGRWWRWGRGEGGSGGAGGLAGRGLNEEEGSAERDLGLGEGAVGRVRLPGAGEGVVGRARLPGAGAGSVGRARLPDCGCGARVAVGAARRCAASAGRERRRQPTPARVAQALREQGRVLGDAEASAPPSTCARNWSAADRWSRCSPTPR
ncbi:hypothetical protein SFUMM280S_03013 [Streptomyces fumanus]